MCAQFRRGALQRWVTFSDAAALCFTWGADTVQQSKLPLIHLLGTLCNSDILLLKG